MVRIDLKDKGWRFKDSTLWAGLGMVVFIVVSMVFQINHESIRSMDIRAMGIEEREVIISLLDKMQRESHLRPLALWLEEKFESESDPILVSNAKGLSPVQMQADGVLVFSEKFFTGDPISQKRSLIRLLTEVPPSKYHPPSELAILPED